MRQTLAALEHALPVLLTLDDDHVQWYGFLYEPAIRIRQLMYQSLALTKQTHQLQATQRQLQQLLSERRIIERVIAGIVNNRSGDDWTTNLVRWRRLTRQYFTPWSLDECLDELEGARKTVHGFQSSTNTHTTEGRFLGWRISQMVDPVREIFCAQYEKTFYDAEMIKFADIGWVVYTNAQTYYDIIIGPRANSTKGNQSHGAYHELLKELGSRLVITRTMEQYPEIGIDVHLLYLVSRVDTEHGFEPCVRSIVCPELTRVIDRPADIWPSILVWMQGEKMEDQTNAFQMRMGGSMRGNDANHAREWKMESMGRVLPRSDWPVDPK